MDVVYVFRVGIRATSLGVVLSLTSLFIAAEDRGILLFSVLRPQTTTDRELGRRRHTNRVALYSRVKAGAQCFTLTNISAVIQFLADGMVVGRVIPIDEVLENVYKSSDPVPPNEMPLPFDSNHHHH
jgi:hypothetical protein